MLSGGTQPRSFTLTPEWKGIEPITVNAEFTETRMCYSATAGLYLVISSIKTGQAQIALANRGIRTKDSCLELFSEIQAKLSQLIFI